MPEKKTPAYVPPYAFVEVIWNDAASNTDTWVSIADVAPPEQVITRGFLVKETDGFVALAGSVSNEAAHEDTVGSTMTIPKGMIVSRRVLRLTTLAPKLPKVKR